MWIFFVLYKTTGHQRSPSHCLPSQVAHLTPFSFFCTQRIIYFKPEKGHLIMSWAEDWGRVADRMAAFLNWHVGWLLVKNELAKVGVLHRESCMGEGAKGRRCLMCCRNCSISVWPVCIVLQFCVVDTYTKHSRLKLCGVQSAWPQNLALLLTGYITLDNLLGVFKPQFTNL